MKPKRAPPFISADVLRANKRRLSTRIHRKIEAKGSDSFDGSDHEAQYREVTDKPTASPHSDPSEPFSILVEASERERIADVSTSQRSAFDLCDLIRSPSISNSSISQLSAATQHLPPSLRAKKGNKSLSYQSSVVSQSSLPSFHALLSPHSPFESNSTIPSQSILPSQPLSLPLPSLQNRPLFSSPPSIQRRASNGDALSSSPYLGRNSDITPLNWLYNSNGFSSPYYNPQPITTSFNPDPKDNAAAFTDITSPYIMTTPRLAYRSSSQTPQRSSSNPFKLLNSPALLSVPDTPDAFYVSEPSRQVCHQINDFKKVVENLFSLGYGMF